MPDSRNLILMAVGSQRYLGPDRVSGGIARGADAGNGAGAGVGAVRLCSAVQRVEWCLRSRDA